jgi:hypothetical protein
MLCSAKRAGDRELLSSFHCHWVDRCLSACQSPAQRQHNNTQRPFSSAASLPFRCQPTARRYSRWLAPSRPRARAPGGRPRASSSPPRRRASPPRRAAASRSRTATGPGRSLCARSASTRRGEPTRDRRCQRRGQGRRGQGKARGDAPEARR